MVCIKREFRSIEVYQARKKLEKEGFSWSEKQEVAKWVFLC